MSQENVELTRGVLDAFNRADLDAYVALMDEDVEAVPRMVGTFGQTVRGHEGIRRWWKDMVEVVPDLAVEIVEVRDLGEVTLVRTNYGGHGAVSEAPIATTNWLSLRWRDGKCVFWISKLTENEALEAVGLRE
jgi:ketosteroid isomerase-like protein